MPKLVQFALLAELMRFHPETVADGFRSVCDTLTLEFTRPFPAEYMCPRDREDYGRHIMGLVENFDEFIYPAMVSGSFQALTTSDLAPLVPLNTRIAWCFIRGGTWAGAHKAAEYALKITKIDGVIRTLPSGGNNYHLREEALFAAAYADAHLRPQEVLAENLIETIMVNWEAVTDRYPDDSHEMLMAREDYRRHHSALTHATQWWEQVTAHWTPQLPLGDGAVTGAPLDDDTVSEDATISEDGTISEDATISDDETVSQDGTSSEEDTVSENDTISENGTISEDEIVSEPLPGGRDEIMDEDLMDWTPENPLDDAVPGPLDIPLDDTIPEALLRREEIPDEEMQDAGIDWEALMDWAPEIPVDDTLPEELQIPLDDTIPEALLNGEEIGDEQFQDAGIDGADWANWTPEIPLDDAVPEPLLSGGEGIWDELQNAGIDPENDWMNW